MSVTLDKNYAFYLTLNLDQYAGKWIAIVDKKVVAQGENLKEVYNQSKKEYPGKKPLFDHISKNPLQFLSK